ncbi:DMT family transporter [Amycolatopsis panacis]|uniref:DMT family transporter n=1 Tax=Amycolatopsis panacis TaxID=2340917 RepID=UPI0013141965|nr:SMR family transporter [Amycolatopsis panacis]
MTVLLLSASVAAQVAGITAIRAADGLRRRGWVVAALAGIGVSVALMSRALQAGLPLAVGYGIWSGAGITCAALGGVVFFGDRLSRTHLIGLGLIVAGVVTVYGAA